jgi:hypothetical protein
MPCVLLGIIVLFRFDDRVERGLADAEEKTLLRSTLDADANKVVSHSFLGALKPPAFVVLALAYFLMHSYGMNFLIPQLVRISGVRDATTIGMLTVLPKTPRRRSSRPSHRFVSCSCRCIVDLQRR